MNKDKGAEFEGSNQKHVDNLIRLKAATIDLMYKVKEEQSKDILLSESAAYGDFKRNLNLLVQHYWPKRNMAKNYEFDEELVEKVEDSVTPECDNLEFEECRRLLYQLTEFMVELGHTKYETDITGRTKV